MRSRERRRCRDDNRHARPEPVLDREHDGALAGRAGHGHRARAAGSQIELGGPRHCDALGRHPDRARKRRKVPDRDHRCTRSRRAQREGRGLGDHRGGVGGRQLDEPCALSSERACREWRRRADEQALQTGRVQRGSCLSEQRGGAGDRGGGDARPAHALEAWRAVRVRARRRRDNADTRADELRLDRAAEREPVGREGRHAAVRGIRSRAERPDRDADVGAARERSAHRPPGRRVDPDHRHGQGLVDAETPGRQPHPVEEHCGGTRTRRSLRDVARSGAGRDECRPSRHEAEPPPVEERTDPRRRPGSRPCHSHLERGARRGRRPGKRDDGVHQNPEAGANHEPRTVGRAAQVGGADGERRGRAARACDAPERGAGGAVVACGRDDEGSEPCRALGRLGDGIVGEGGEGRSESDQGDSRRVVRVAVRIRVDRALEACDDLVSPRVDRPVARRIRLPARNTHRQHRGAGGDAGDSRRPARSHEDAGELGAVLLDTRRLAGLRPRQCAWCLPEHVVPRQHTTTEVGL